MGKLGLYEDIREKLGFDENGDPTEEAFFQEYGIYNNQFDLEARGQINSFKWPCIFVEIGNIDYRDMFKGRQRGTVSLTFHIGLRIGGDHSKNAALIFAGIQDLQKRLHFVTSDQYNYLRLRERASDTWDKVVTWEVDYTVEIGDDDAYSEKDYQAVNDWALVLNAQIEEQLSSTITEDEAIIVNSDETYNEKAKGGTTHELPDITIYNSDEDDSITRPAAVDIILPEGFNAGGVPTGRKFYRPLIPENNGTSYASNDLVYNESQGVYDYTPPGDPADDMDLVDFYTTRGNNEFGSAWRFTGKTGGYYNHNTDTYHDLDGTTTTKAGAFPDDYMIDHHTGLGWHLLLETSANWTNQLAKVPLTKSGFNDFRMPHTFEVFSIKESNSGGDYYFKPLQAYGHSSTNNWICESFTPNTALGMQMRYYGMEVLNKGSNIQMLLVRNHYV